MLVAVTVIFSLGSMVANQVNQLAGELPRYQTTLREKAQHLRDNFTAPGVFRNVVDLINQCKEVNTFVPALAYTFARKQTEIVVEHEERSAGESNALAA